MFHWLFFFACTPPASRLVVNGGLTHASVTAAAASSSIRRRLAGDRKLLSTCTRGRGRRCRSKGLGKKGNDLGRPVKGAVGIFIDERLVALIAVPVNTGTRNRQTIAATRCSSSQYRSAAADNRQGAKRCRIVNGGLPQMPVSSIRWFAHPGRWLRNMRIGILACTRRPASA